MDCEYRFSLRGDVGDSMTSKCEFDPTLLVGYSLGQMHCPICGEMVLVGCTHPDYSLWDDPNLETDTSNFSKKLRSEGEENEKELNPTLK